MTLLSVRHVRKSFGAHVVLEDLTMSVEAGQCVVDLFEQGGAAQDRGLAGA